MGWHVGRAWVDLDMEDACPCPQELCGLVDMSKADASCVQHGLIYSRTIRQSHPEDDCPEVRTDGKVNEKA